MAKIKKEKFEFTGGIVDGRTTFAGDIELYSHYNANEDFFYFEEEEMAKYFDKEEIPCSRIFFKACHTKREAVKLLEMLIGKKGKKTKMLRLEVRMPDDFYKIPNPKYTEKDEFISESRYISNPDVPEFLSGILNDIYNGRGISINYKRVIKYEFGDVVRYVDSNKDWKFKMSNLNSYDTGLIEWSPEREQFLIGMQEQLDAICQRVLDFFSTNTKEELMLRMEDMTKSLPIHKENGNNAK